MKLILSFIFSIIVTVSTGQTSASINLWNKALNPVYQYDSPTTTFFKLENKYFIKEWNNKSIGLDLKSKKGRVIALVSQQGNRHFSRNIGLVGYAQEMSPKLQLGLSINYGYIQQIEFDKNPKIIFPTFGMKYSLSERDDVYSSITNEWINGATNQLPNSILLYWDHTISKNSKVTLGAKSMTDLTQISGSYNHSLNENISLCIQINSSPAPIITFFYLNLTGIDIYLQNEYHQQLGISNSIGAAYKW